jgi:hypothetical protein
MQLNGQIVNTIKNFEVLTVVVEKSSILWDITRCLPLKVNLRLRALLPNGITPWFFTDIFIDLEDGTRHVSPKRRRVISQKKKLIRSGSSLYCYTLT